MSISYPLARVPIFLHGEECEEMGRGKRMEEKEKSRRENGIKFVSLSLFKVGLIGMRYDN